MGKIKFTDYRDTVLNKKDEELEEGELIPTSYKRREIHPLKRDPDDEKRRNFRIIKCCLNCKYHFGCAPAYLRLGCSFPYTIRAMVKKLKWPKGVRPDKDFLMALPPTHATCCCNAHKFRLGNDGGLGMNHVTKYCGAEYFGEDDL